MVKHWKSTDLSGTLNSLLSSTSHMGMRFNIKDSLINQVAIEEFAFLAGPIT